MDSIPRRNILDALVAEVDYQIFRGCDYADNLKIGDSPIERIFACTMMVDVRISSLCFTGAVITRKGERFHGEDITSPTVFDICVGRVAGPGANPLLMERQVAVGGYRVDFVFGGIVNDGQGNVVKPLIVECDGHDFHEKTKDQAARDKARDRYLQSEGYYVMRFTGSEIYNEPYRCWREVADFMKEKLAW